MTPQAEVVARRIVEQLNALPERNDREDAMDAVKGVFCSSCWGPAYPYEDEGRQSRQHCLCGYDV